jgi:Lar family restriction alleviation protein
MPDATTPNLLPCPFCGSTDDDLVYREPDKLGYISIGCIECGAEGPLAHYNSTKGTEATQAEAAADWNQRSAWQPIETAPKDGAKFLALDGEELHVAWRYEDRWIYDQEMESPYLTHWCPTHWQPLPSPLTTPNSHA